MHGFQQSPQVVQKGLSSKAAASEEANRTLRYVEPLSDARTMMEGFFNNLLGRVRSCEGMGAYDKRCRKGC